MLNIACRMRINLALLHPGLPRARKGVPWYVLHAACGSTHAVTPREGVHGLEGTDVQRVHACVFR